VEPKLKANLPARLSFSQGFVAGAGIALVLAMALSSQSTWLVGNQLPSSAAQISGPSFAAVARRVEGAVVNINTEQVVSTATPDPFSWFFGEEWPFGQQTPRSRTQRSLGSGFIVDPSGYVLTNNHVVERASRIKVRLNDGRQLDGTIVGTDPQTDLAVLQIKADRLPALKLAEGDDIQVGDWVLAFGSPFGLEHTMTAGIISATGRVIGAGPYDNFLQTDAAINPGNSGGPLVNLRGEAVGINTVIFSRSGGFEGVGFAIPVSLARGVYGQLTTTGKVTRGWLGVTLQEMTPELARAFGLKDGQGVVVAEVEPGSPAARAGILSGDVLVNYNGEPIQNARDLSLAVAETKVGSSSRVTLYRNGRPMELQLHIGERPGDPEELARAGTPSNEEPGRLGMTLADLTPETASRMNLSGRAGGAVIAEVRPGSPAESAGLRPGDVIREVNRKAVKSAAEVVSSVKGLGQGSSVLLRIERQGSTQYVAMQIP
jgi:serine protease Do